MTPDVPKNQKQTLSRHPALKSPAAAGKADQPNILLITTDQQYARMMSCAGEASVKTPALDALAARGVRFENAYCANPVCVPSRYSMITGYMPHVFDGLETNRTRGQNVTQPVVEKYIQTQPMGWLLRNAGYDTFYGGKLHVQQLKRFSEEAEKPFGFTSLTPDPRRELAQKTAALLREKRDKPFLVWASFMNPHDICKVPKEETKDGWDRLKKEFPNHQLPPLPANFEPTQGEIEWIKLFREGQVRGTGLNGRFGCFAHKWSEEHFLWYRWSYRRFMETVDGEIQIILKALEESGRDKDTVVIFTSDHGDHDGAHRLTMKRSFYEESANVPLIVADPGIAKAGTLDRRSLVSTGLDLIPTMCDYAGVEVPAGLRGRSFRPQVDGRKGAEGRDCVVGQTNTGRMLRTARYKYNVHFVDGKSGEQLFDMTTDRGEMNNLVGIEELQPVLREHRRILTQWVADNKDEKGKRYLAAL